MIYTIIYRNDTGLRQQWSDRFGRQDLIRPGQRLTAHVFGEDGIQNLRIGVTVNAINGTEIRYQGNQWVLWPAGGGFNLVVRQETHNSITVTLSF